MHNNSDLSHRLNHLSNNASTSLSRMHHAGAGPTSSLFHPPKHAQQPTPNVIHVCCQSYECGATLEVDIPPSHLDGTNEVLVRCGNCKRLLRVQLPEEFCPAGASPHSSLTPKHPPQEHINIAAADTSSISQQVAHLASINSRSCSAHGSMASPPCRPQQRLAQQHQEYLEKLIDDTATAAVERQRKHLTYLQKIAAGAAAAGSNRGQWLAGSGPALPAAVWKQQQQQQQLVPPIIKAHSGDSMAPPAARRMPVVIASSVHPHPSGNAPDSQVLSSPFESAPTPDVTDGWLGLLQPSMHDAPLSGNTAAAAAAGSKRYLPGASESLPNRACICDERPSAHQLSKRLRLLRSAPPGLQYRVLQTAGASSAARQPTSRGPAAANWETARFKENCNGMQAPLPMHAEGTAAGSALHEALEQTWDAICSTTQQQQQQQQHKLPLVQVQGAASAAASTRMPHDLLGAAATASSIMPQKSFTAAAAAEGAGLHLAPTVDSPRKFMDLLRDDTPEPPPQLHRDKPTAPAASIAPAAAAAAAQGRHGSDDNSVSATELAGNSSADISATPAVPSSSAQLLSSGAQSVTGVAGTHSRQSQPNGESTGLDSSTAPTADLELHPPPGAEAETRAQAPRPAKPQGLAVRHQQGVMARLQHHRQQHLQRQQEVLPEPALPGGVHARRPVRATQQAVQQLLATANTETHQACATVDANSAAVNGLQQGATTPGATSGANSSFFAGGVPPLTRHNSAPVTTGMIGQQQASTRTAYCAPVTTHGPQAPPTK